MDRTQTNTVALRSAMAKAGLNKICQLSYASGVNRNTVGGIVNGKIQPSAQVIRRLTTALNLSPEEAGLIFLARNLLDA